MRHLDADAAGDLVAHAGVAVFHVIAARPQGAPELVQLGRQRARRAHDDVVRRRLRMRALDRADHLAVVGQRRRRDFADADDRGHRRAPRLGFPRRLLLPCGGGGPAAQARGKSVERRRGVAEHGGRAPFERIEGIDVDGHETGLRKQRVRAGREVGEPRADGDDEVGVARELIGGRAAGHADGSGLQRVVPWQRALARLRLRHRHAMRLGKPAQRVGAAVAVEDAAAGNEHRLLRRAQQARHRVELDRLGLRRADANERRCKELRRKVVRLRLHVLRQGQRDRTALRRIGQHGDRARQTR